MTGAMNIIRRGETIYRLDEMTVAGLGDLEMLLHDDITHIKDSLDKARAKVITHGVYADPDWYRRAKTASRINARQLEQVKRLRAARARRERSEVFPIGPFFMDAARAILPPETFEAIFAAAKTMRREAEAEEWRPS